LLIVFGDGQSNPQTLSFSPATQHHRDQGLIPDRFECRFMGIGVHVVIALKNSPAGLSAL
jgi:hypothetical protein